MSVAGKHGKEAVGTFRSLIATLAWASGRTTIGRC